MARGLGYASDMTDDGRVTSESDDSVAIAPTTSEPSDLPIHGICPFLLAADGGWRSATAAREHRCTAVSPPSPLAAEKQRRLCLTNEHTTCATYLAAGEARGAGHQAPERRRPLARTTPLVLDQGRLPIALPIISASPGLGQGVLIGLLGLAFCAVLLARLAGGGGSPSGAIVPVGSPGASAVATDGAIASHAPTKSTASPKASGDAGAGAKASPTLVPTQTKPTPVPAGERPATYKIKRGDTLSGIAAKFGISVKALVKLNKIDDPSKIRVGQILKLP